MVEYSFRKGLYPYPLKYLPSDGGTVPDVFVPGNAAVQSGTTNWYIFCLTPEQLQGFRNIINVGSPIVYQDEFQTWWQRWAQLEQFPNTIPEDSCLDLCQLIIDCINNTPELQQLIQNQALAAAVEPDAEADSSILATDLISDTTNCDDDKIFGAITGLIDLINNLAEDFIQILQDQNNTIGRLAQLIETIPGVGELAPADLGELLESFIEDMEQLYLAAYTQALRDEYRCDLFCDYRIDCNFSFLEVFQYFENKVTGSISLDSFDDFIGFYITGQFTGETLVAAWHAFVMGILAYGSSVLGINEDQMVRMVSALFNDPDSDWQTLCTDCGWVWNSDFANDQNIWQPFTGTYGDYATYTASVGFESVDSQTGTTTYSRLLQIETQEFTPTIIDTITVNFDLSKALFTTPTVTAFNIVAIKNDNSTVRVDIENQNINSGNGIEQTLQVNETDIKRIRVLIRCSARDTVTYGGSITLNQITVVGGGDNPFD